MTADHQPRAAEKTHKARNDNPEAKRMVTAHHASSKKPNDHPLRCPLRTQMETAGTPTMVRATAEIVPTRANMYIVHDGTVSQKGFGTLVREVYSCTANRIAVRTMARALPKAPRTKGNQPSPELFGLTIAAHIPLTMTSWSAINSSPAQL